MDAMRCGLMRSGLRRRVMFPVLVLVASGCPSDGELLQRGPSTSALAETEEQRSRYLAERTQASARWLLANRVKQGMSPGDVAEVFGEAGERVYEDEWLKTGDGNYQIGDETYKWGPDDHGTSYFLMFRGGKLVNFDGGEYR